MASSGPIASSAPSPGWRPIQIAVLVVLLIATNATTAAVMYLTIPRSDPPLVVPTRTLLHGALLDSDRTEATVYSSDTRGPFIVAASSAQDSLEDCILTVNEEEAHKARCSKFHYEYRFQARAGFKISFEFKISLAFPSNGPAAARISVQVATNAHLQGSWNVALLAADEDSGFLGAFGYLSQTQGGLIRTIVDDTFDLPAGSSTGFPEMLKGRLWVNITVLTTLTFEFKINGLVVVEGTCTGVIVTSYYWVDLELEFGFELSITAEEIPVAGTLLIEGVAE